jgi:hypothetical protein
MTLTCGYLIHSNLLTGKSKQVDRLILTIYGNDVNPDQNTTVVYEDRGDSPPTKRVYESSSIVAVSSIYEQKGYQLEKVSEFLKKILDQDVVVTRIWFSKKK